MGRDYSLKLIFLNKKGEYLSDVIVKGIGLEWKNNPNNGFKWSMAFH